jgi:hypothetical protein
MNLRRKVGLWIKGTAIALALLNGLLFGSLAMDGQWSIWGTVGFLVAGSLYWVGSKFHPDGSN